MRVSSLLILVFWGAIRLSAQELEKLHNEINTLQYDEISPVLSEDGHRLYFTRVGSPDFDSNLVVGGKNVFREKSGNYKTHLQDAYKQLTGKLLQDPSKSDFNQDIWIAESETDFFDKVIHPDFPLNNALPNSVCSVTSQSNQVIVINQFPKEGGMKKGFSQVRQRHDGSWADPEPLQIRNYYTKSPGVNLTLSKDGDILLLSLDRSEGMGKHDIYVCFREETGAWSEPHNLGEYVNTPFTESTPHLSEDNRTLFFSSDRPGADGVDIFYTQREGDDWKNWSLPRRLGPPVNSPFDDGQPHFNAATGFLYFSSNRDGKSDIFRVRLKEPQAQKDVVVRGKIISSATGELLSAKVLSGTGQEAYQKTFYFSSDGYFRMRIPKGERIRMVAEKEGYIGQVQVFDFQSDQYYFKEEEVTLLLDPLEVDAKISLAPIYFQQSEAIILEKSFPTLEDLANILIKYPDMQIRIEGHTDNVGEWKSLVKLSEDRASAVRDFLVNRGIGFHRIQTAGLGPSKPINENMNEEQRQMNRRVEVRITKIE